MIVGRIVGWVFLFGALSAFAVEVIRWVGVGGYRVVPLGEIWYNLHPNSLVGFQALIEQQVSPALWSTVFQPVLLLAGWVVLGASGIVFLWLFRRRVHRRRSFRKG